MMNTQTSIEQGWKFDNSYTRLPGSFYTKLNPVPVRLPRIVAFNDRLAESLGLDIEALNDKGGVAVFAGNRIPEGGAPIAQAYAGHQFGHFTMLGDGRAILIGEQITPKGERFDIQLKGSGRTPYSRGGDGRAALGPMLREYIISEAMHALGIPTTRSLAVVTTGESVFRETELPGAVLTRVAASHIRVGTFQYVSNWCSLEELRILAEYTLERHFPGFGSADNKYLYLLQRVVQRQAELIARWQLIGFVHGVMNTDNVALSGETIDYGPCAFMDTYDPATVFSSIDHRGRYAYGNQPDIALWNLARFAETLLPLLHDDRDQAVEVARDAVSEFDSLFRYSWLMGMKSKLGIFNDESEDETLFNTLLNLMSKYRSDYTNTFKALTSDMLGGTALFEAAEFSQWNELWLARLSRQEESMDDSKLLMQRSNPAVIPRNHRVEDALQAAVNEDDYSVMNRLLEVLSDPYAYSHDQTEYSEPLPSSACPYRTFCGT